MKVTNRELREKRILQYMVLKALFLKTDEDQHEREGDDMDPMEFEVQVHLFHEWLKVSKPKIEVEKGQ